MTDTYVQCDLCGGLRDTVLGNRDRLVLEDYAESTGHYSEWHLCQLCWSQLLKQLGGSDD